MNFRRRKEDTRSGNLNLKGDYTISLNSDSTVGRNSKESKEEEWSSLRDWFVKQNAKRLGVKHIQIWLTRINRGGVKKLIPNWLLGVVDGWRPLSSEYRYWTNPFSGSISIFNLASIFASTLWFPPFPLGVDGSRFCSERAVLFFLVVLCGSGILVCLGNVGVNGDLRACVTRWIEARTCHCRFFATKYRIVEATAITTTTPTTTDKMMISWELKLIDSLSWPEAPALFPSFELDMLIYTLEIIRSKTRHSQNLSICLRLEECTEVCASLQWFSWYLGFRSSEESLLKVNIL